MRKLRNILTSPVTTFAGLTGGLAAIKEGIINHNYLQVIYGVGLLIVGLLSNEQPTQK